MSSVQTISTAQRLVPADAAATKKLVAATAKAAAVAAKQLQRDEVKKEKHSWMWSQACRLHHASVAAAALFAIYVVAFCGAEEGGTKGGAEELAEGGEHEDAGGSSSSSLFARWRFALLLTATWWVYSDFYSSLLHCVLDDPRCLAIPGLSPVAHGFQDHHEFPMESTWGKGLQHLCDDTVRGQWVTGLLALVLSGRRDRGTALMVLLKWVTCAYGTQVGHYYAHCSHTAPEAVKALQRMKLLLPPAQHWRHHKEPYEAYFGIVNGLTNHHVNPNYLRKWSFKGLLGVWAFLSAFDIVIAEEIVKAWF